ncbi:hypothetical protein AB8A20_08075 [Tardiphaga sp. 604_B6_N1_1]|uniref:hypothetical protein n=1 Tax=unclassified Tardiphaga TaxID=2631404 RepID=UPI003F1F356D
MGLPQLLFRMTGAGRRRLRGLAVFDTAFVAKVTAFLGLLALCILAVFVQLFLDEAAPSLILPSTLMFISYALGMKNSANTNLIRTADFEGSPTVALLDISRCFQ